MATDDFSEPPRRADSKNPIFIFCRFLGLGHLRGPGISLVWILGVPSVEPLLGEGLARGLYRPRPLQLKARLPQTHSVHGVPSTDVRIPRTQAWGIHNSHVGNPWHTAQMPSCLVRAIPAAFVRPRVPSKRLAMRSTTTRQLSSAIFAAA